MYIKKIVIKNFKSFGRKVEIPLFRGFTVISGPNGSGKSNIVDSIVFCLGLTTSTKVLRAEKLTDLVHNSNGKNNKNIEKVEVTITFDNSNLEIPLKGDITVTRKIRLTEKGYYSNYYLNGKACSLSDIHEILSRAGIHSNAYNVIMQGDVTRITEMTPVQRRKIIDDIAGISEFDEKKDKAIEELDKVREEIEKIDAVLMEVNSRLSQLEKDREEAIKYKSLIEEKNYCNKVLETHKFKNLKLKKDRIIREIEKLERDKDVLSHKFAEMSSEVELTNKKAKELSEKIAEITGAPYEEISEKILNISSEIETIKKSEKFYTNEIARYKKELTNINFAISKLEEEIEKYDINLANLSIDEASVKSVVDELLEKMNSIKMELQKVDEKHRKFRDELTYKENLLKKLKNDKSELIKERDRLINTIRMAEINENSIVGKLNGIKSLIKDLENSKEEKLKELNKAEVNEGKIINKRNELDKILFDLANKLSEIDENIKSIEIELAKLRAEISAIDSGFSRGVSLVLEAKDRRALPGIYGTVAQLCQVEEKFALALEIAAGNLLQCIVVDNEDDAVRAINYLKQIRGGRATFLPLNRIKRDFGRIKLDKDILSYPGVIDYAVNLLKFDRKFKPIFNFVFRDTLVVNKIETAKMIMNRYRGRIVTLDGDLVERTGVMSGGSIERRRGLLLSKELVEKEKKLMEEITVLKSKKAEISGKIRNLKIERKKLQEEVDKANKLVVNLKNEIESINNRISEEKEQIDPLLAELDNIKAQKEDCINRIKDIDKEISIKSKNIEKLEGGIKQIEKKLRNSGIPELNKKYKELEEEYNRNKEILSSIQNKIESIEFKKKQTEERLKEKLEESKNIQDKIAELQSEIEMGREKIRELESKLEELKKEEKRIGAKVENLRKERDKLIEKIKNLEKDREACRYSITAIDEKIKARREALRSAEEEIKKIDYNEIIDDVELPPIDEVTSKIREIDRELKKLGEVNLKAIHEYERVKSRRDNLLERKLNLEKERGEILDRINKYEQMKRDAFFEAFNAINNNFAEVIKRLTDGEGELYLDKNDPFNSGLHIKVKVYGKPVQKIESLSGGEKSLIALALIFAIQMYKPAPFYAFDEIDMFLDGANVSRVARLIKERSKDAQFIVVSLRKPTLEMADAIIGVTMDKSKSSKVTGIKLREQIKIEKAKV